MEKKQYEILDSGGSYSVGYWEDKNKEKKKGAKGASIRRIFRNISKHFDNKSDAEKHLQDINDGKITVDDSMKEKRKQDKEMHSSIKNLAHGLIGENRHAVNPLNSVLDTIKQGIGGFNNDPFITQADKIRDMINPLGNREKPFTENYPPIAHHTPGLDALIDIRDEQQNNNKIMKYMIDLSKQQHESDKQHGNFMFWVSFIGVGVSILSVFILLFIK